MQREEYLLKVNVGEVYTTNKDIKVSFYDENRRPITTMEVTIEKYKNKASFQVPQLSEFLSIHAGYK